MVENAGHNLDDARGSGWQVTRGSNILDYTIENILVRPWAWGKPRRRERACLESPWRWVFFFGNWRREGKFPDADWWSLVKGSQIFIQ